MKAILTAMVLGLSQQGLMAATPGNVGENIASQLKYSLNHASSQKAWVQSLQLSEEQKKQISQSFQKHGYSGTPVPNATQNGSVLIMKTSVGDYKIDFSQLEKNEVILRDKRIPFTEKTDIEEIYKLLRQNQASHWLLDRAFAGDSSSSDFYATVFAFTGIQEYWNSLFKGKNTQLTPTPTPAPLSLAAEITTQIFPAKLMSFHCDKNQLKEFTIAGENSSSLVRVKTNYKKDKLSSVDFTKDDDATKTCSFLMSLPAKVVGKSSAQSCDLLKSGFKGQAEDIYPIAAMTKCCETAGCEKQVDQRIAVKPNNPNPSFSDGPGTR